MTKIKISVRNIIKFIIFFTIAVSSLSSEIGLPQNLFYMNDILLILVLCLYYKKMNIFKKLKMQGINYVFMLIANIKLVKKRWSHWKFSAVSSCFMGNEEYFSRNNIFHFLCGLFAL